MHKYRYEIIAFLTGTAVMILEIVGARLIAPYFGTSIYVWTSIIGVILGALALGYAYGGRLADRYEVNRSLLFITLVAAVLVIILGFVQAPILTFLADLELNDRLGALLAAILLFGLPSSLIGMVSPHLAKIRIDSLATSGQSVGRLEAAGAVGSITGTFLCGYFLLGLVGSQTIVFGVAVLLIVTSLLVLPRQVITLRLGLFVFAMVGAIAGPTITSGTVLADIDTSYARYQVKAIDYGAPIIALQNDNRGIQSGVLANGDDELVFAYVQKFNDALLSRPEAKNILVIGGGTFTFPSYAAAKHPTLQVDAVELDPALEGIAKNYFFLQERPNLRIINEDGRTYLNKGKGIYDIIYLDAYSSLNPPFQLTSQEAFHKAKKMLAPGGVIVGNVIGKNDAYNDPFLQAMAATLRSEFNTVTLQSAQPGVEGSANFIVTAGNNRQAVTAVAQSVEAPLEALRPQSLVLTDDYAPIEQLNQDKAL